MKTKNMIKYKNMYILCVCFILTSGFTGFNISCSSVIMTVEHDDRRPRDEVSPTALAGTVPSQKEAIDLTELLVLNWDEGTVDLSELTDRMLLRLSLVET